MAAHLSVLLADLCAAELMPSEDIGQRCRGRLPVLEQRHREQSHYEQDVGELIVDRLPFQRGERGDPDESTLQLADVALDAQLMDELFAQFRSR